MLFLGLKIAQAIMTFANSNHISISNTTIRVVIVVSVFIRGHPLKSPVEYYYFRRSVDPV